MRFYTQKGVISEILWLCKPTVSSAVQPHSFISCPGGWFPTIPQVKQPDVEVLVSRGYIWSAVGRLVGHTVKFSKTILEEAYGREINIKFSDSRSGGHSWSQHANCTLPQNLKHLWHCVVWQTAHFRVAFCCPCTRYTCVMIMLFNQLLDMPHLSGGWIIWSLEKCSLTGM